MTQDKIQWFWQMPMVLRTPCCKIKVTKLLALEPEEQYYGVRICTNCLKKYQISLKAEPNSHIQWIPYAELGDLRATI